VIPRMELPFDASFGTNRHQFVLPVDEADARALAAARAEGSVRAIAAWAAARSRHVRRPADTEMLRALFDAMWSALEASGVASTETLDALIRIRKTELGPQVGLSFTRWMERLVRLAEMRAPSVIVDYQVAALPSRAPGDPTVEAGIQWEVSPPPSSIAPAFRACLAWEIGILGFRGIAVEGGVDALARAGPTWDMPLFSVDDVGRSFDLPEGAGTGPSVLVANASLLPWVARIEALPDRLPIDVSHARAREVIRAWQAGIGQPPAWFLAHPDRGSPDAVPLMAITLRAQWSEAWAERRVALVSRIRELAPFGFGMLSVEGRYPAQRRPR
jgi:hypothetical protein